MFELHSNYQPAGDQPEAIRSLVDGVRRGEQFQMLLGVTGSGKTFTVANVIQELKKPTLILTHNKTLAAQLYQEFKEFFPNNAVEYFVSYYDYYQPEAYVVASDTFIEKDAGINEEIDKLRMRATTSLMTREDVIVVASVSCIYGLGSPKEYFEMMLRLRVGQELERDSILRHLVDIQYGRNDYELERGSFRVKGDVVEIRPAYEDFAYRVEMFGDEIEKLSRIHMITGDVLEELDEIVVAPAKHFVTREEGMERVVRELKAEMDAQVNLFNMEGKAIESQRIASRTGYDMEMLLETGYCNGVENYSRVIEGRAPGTRPHTLIDFFGEDWLLVLDESHVSVSQVGGMFNGDRSRKQNLVDYGFRLPSALDNRPMSFVEFEAAYPSGVIFLSATPGDYELKKTEGVVVEQLIRPTGLLDPVVEIFPVEGQVDHLMAELETVIERQERALVTTLTKKSAEDFTEYLQEAGFRVRYMHSNIDTLERSEIIRSLRQGEFDILVGINLLREGLDLPEVSLVAILDADKEGFLRSKRSLIQTMGRASRNVNGRVLLFADRVTDSMKNAIDETSRRRKLQQEFNEKHRIVPRSIVRPVEAELRIRDPLDLSEEPFDSALARDSSDSYAQKEANVFALEARMHEAAENLDFEEAARLRDLLISLKEEKS